MIKKAFVEEDFQILDIKDQEEEEEEYLNKLNEKNFISRFYLKNRKKIIITSAILFSVTILLKIFFFNQNLDNRQYRNSSWILFK